ncbi:MAG: hypothetical protein J0G29_01460 [Alphaproteobacteria bacterium]|nr:hypothetical protein [Alphaproteobacteria bacterium]OJV47542.1 MAG: hypothetical protein BGO28_06820 [Alphaproteobacteria bacterium 43-37]
MKQKIQTVILGVMLLVSGELHAGPEDCFEPSETMIASIAMPIQQAFEEALKIEECVDDDDMMRSGLVTTLDEVAAGYLDSFAKKMSITPRQRQFLYGIFDLALAAAFKALAGIEVSYPVKPSTVIKAGCRSVIQRYLDEKVSSLLKGFLLSCYDNLTQSIGR